MTKRTLTRHDLPVALLLTALLLFTTVASAEAMIAGPRSAHPAAHKVHRSPNVSAVHHTAGYARVPPRICPIQWRRGPWYVRRLIVCAAHYYGVPGGSSEALYIADRESHFHPRAYNAWSGAMGVYQHLRRYWPGRAFAYGFRGWSGFNARANIIVTMRMVRRLGNWSPWGI
jgi:hypothetical protein